MKSIEELKSAARLNTINVQGKRVPGVVCIIGGAAVQVLYVPSASGQAEHEQFHWYANQGYRDEQFIAHLLEQQANAERETKRALGLDLLEGQA
ncbi:hypothetical protein [Paraburkholderia terrae]|uniref:hypothetical protein n=1 Tax=Paraburkholderia terrae TaxID=311230 RepID=UPI001EE2990F|nr:hypothetical protein [Paraburkholderia terrae]GJH02265.1 hypothetical protein CBA19C8_16930 [Paraburkholderia terrae]